MRILPRLVLLASVMVFACPLALAQGETTSREGSNLKAPLRIAVIASLSGFAASFGQSVLEGIQLAADQLQLKGLAVEIVVEDDNSQSNKTLPAYQSLKGKGKFDALITGSWWVRNLVQIAERDQLPFLSVETVYDRDFVFSPNYFVIGGDLRDWVNAYSSLIASKGWKRAAIVHFISGFGYTLADALKINFSTPGREFAGAVEYQDVDALEMGTLLLRAKKLNPDVVYLDGQPQSIAGFIKKRTELNLVNLPIIGNTSIKNGIEQGLIPVAQQNNLFYTERSTLSPAFEKLFVDKFGKKPQLNADLGYYALLIFAQHRANADPRAAIRNEITEVDGIKFSFNKDNVLQGLKWNVFAVENGKIEPDE